MFAKKSLAQCQQGRPEIMDLWTSLITDERKYFTLIKKIFCSQSIVKYQLSSTQRDEVYFVVSLVVVFFFVGWRVQNDLR
jgi:hypothetical protein